MHLASALALALVFLLGCDTLRPKSHLTHRRYDKQQLQELLTRFEAPGLVLGEFPLAPNAVIDGDTIKVAGLETTLRLLGIDTEETFKNEPDRRHADADWDDYLRSKQKDGSRPVKLGTPLGEDAKRFAIDFFKGVDKVRLERDHPKDLRGRYNRYLVYVFAEKNGEWVNYNVESVRAGMSPYFMKYGYSRRFHREFVRAQEEARRAELGIWSHSGRHYPDYGRRLRWWTARAEFIAAFERDGAGRDNYITLTHWDSLALLERHVDQEIEVLGTVSDVKLGDRGPTKVMLGRRLLSDFPLIFFDKDVYGSSGIGEYRGEFVRVRGKVTRYFNKFTQKDELQIQIEYPGQILLSVLPEPLPDRAKLTAEQR